VMKQRRSNEKAKSILVILTIGVFQNGGAEGTRQSLTCCMKKVGGKKHDVFLDLL
jgi:hypothetical protein